MEATGGRGGSSKGAREQGLRAGRTEQGGRMGSDVSGWMGSGVDWGEVCGDGQVDGGWSQPMKCFMHAATRGGDADGNDPSSCIPSII